MKKTLAALLAAVSLTMALAACSPAEVVAKTPAPWTDPTAGLRYCLDVPPMDITDPEWAIFCNNVRKAIATPAAS